MTAIIECPDCAGRGWWETCEDDGFADRIYRCELCDGTGRIYERRRQADQTLPAPLVEQLETARIKVREWDNVYTIAWLTAYSATGSSRTATSVAVDALRMFRRILSHERV